MPSQSPSTAASKLSKNPRHWTNVQWKEIVFALRTSLGFGACAMIFIDKNQGTTLINAFVGAGIALVLIALAPGPETGQAAPSVVATRHTIKPPQISRHG